LQLATSLMLEQKVILRTNLFRFMAVGLAALMDDLSITIHERMCIRNQDRMQPIQYMAASGMVTATKSARNQSDCIPERNTRSQML
jgi:hypothetical protein